MKRINEYYCALDANEIILHCMYTDENKHDFVVWRNDSDDKYPIHINTDVRIYGGIVQISYHENDYHDYDRGIAKNLEQFEKMSILKLQEHAYNAYMDGAR